MRIARTNLATALLASGLSIASAGLFPACESAPKAGQSGSENIPGGGSGGGRATPCPCGPYDALRVTVLSQDHGNLTLRVEEVLHSELPLVAGDVIEADRGDDIFACSLGCAPIADGKQAFALYTPCDALEACIQTCERENALGSEEPGRGSCECRAQPPADWSTTTGFRTCGIPYFDDFRHFCKPECEESTRDACPRLEQDYKRGRVRLSPWGEKIVFARSARGELNLPRSQLDKLWRDEGANELENLLRCQERVGDWSQLLENPEGL
jgi:hypothetical protein